MTRKTLDLLSEPLDGIDLTPVLDGRITERPSPLFFWSYNTQRLARARPEPWIDPELQTGTTPLVKLMGGKATRDFKNFRHPAITDDDYLGPKAIVDGSYKLVIHDRAGGDVRRELFDLEADPAEKTNIIKERPDLAEKLADQLRDWQESLLHSLTGADYQP